MTEPRDMQRERQAEAAADQESEAIQDLDVTGDDADRIAAGDGQYLTYSLSQGTVSGR
jgi:hypothetical protein